MLELLLAAAVAIPLATVLCTNAEEVTTTFNLHGTYVTDIRLATLT